MDRPPQIPRLSSTWLSIWLRHKLISLHDRMGTAQQGERLEEIRIRQDLSQQNSRRPQRARHYTAADRRRPSRSRSLLRGSRAYFLTLKMRHVKLPLSVDT